jgi:hypothetical protein
VLPYWRSKWKHIEALKANSCIGLQLSHLFIPYKRWQAKMWRRAVKHISLPFSQELSVYIWCLTLFHLLPPYIYLSLLVVIVIDLASSQSMLLPSDGNTRHYRMLRTMQSGLCVTWLGYPFSTKNEVPYLMPPLWPPLIMCVTSILLCQWEQISAAIMFCEFMNCQRAFSLRVS